MYIIQVSTMLSIVKYDLLNFFIKRNVPMNKMYDIYILVSILPSIFISTDTTDKIVTLTFHS